MERKKINFDRGNLYTLLTKIFVKLYILAFVFMAPLDGFSQSSNAGSKLVLRSNLQSNMAATTLNPSSNASIKAQYVIGQTPLLGKVSRSGFEVRQGFIQPLVNIGFFTQPILQASIYPNPFSDRLQIQFDNIPSHDVHASLYDMRGRLIHYSHFQTPTNNIELELGHLADAKYLLYINTGNQVITKHIIKYNQ